MEKNELPSGPNILPNTAFLMRVFSDAEARNIISECDDREALSELYEQLIDVLAKMLPSEEESTTLDVKQLILRAYQEGKRQADTVPELIEQEVISSRLQYSQLEQSLAYKLKGHYASEIKEMGKMAPVLRSLGRTATTSTSGTRRDEVPHMSAPWLAELDRMPDDALLDNTVTEFIASYSGASNYLEFVDDPQITGPSQLLIGHLTSAQELSYTPEDEQRLGVTLRLSRETYRKILSARYEPSVHDMQEGLVMRILLGMADGEKALPKARYSEAKPHGLTQLPPAPEVDDYVKSAFQEMSAFRRYVVKRTPTIRVPKGR